MCNAVGKLLPAGDKEFTIMVFGFQIFAGGDLVLLLPETFNKELANSIDEGNNSTKGLVEYLAVSNMKI